MIILAFFLFLFVFSNFENNKFVFFKKQSKYLFLILFIFTTFFIGFRSINVGNDTPLYVREFNEMSYLYDDPINIFESGFESFYRFSLYIIRTLTSNYTIMLLLCALPFSFGFCLLISKYSQNSFLSFVIFCALGIFFFALSGVRQSIALGFSFIALHFIFNKKIIKALIFIAIGFLFHNSCIVFLLVPLILKIKTTNFNWTLVLLGLIIGLFKWTPILNLLILLDVQGRFRIYDTSLNLVMFAVQLALLLPCWLLRKEYLKKSKEGNLLFNMAFLGLFFQALTPVVGEFFRVSYFFSFSLVLLVPNTLSVVRHHNLKVFLTFLIAAMSIIYTCISQNFFTSYQFFWEV